MAVLALGVLSVLGALGYLLFWPVPIQPVAWRAARSKGHVGSHARNARLTDLRLIDLGGSRGPEHIAVDAEGRIYAAVEDGRVLRVHPDGSGRVTYAHTGGRPLGLAFDPDGRLLIADAYRGLLRVAADRRVEMLADHVNGSPIRFANAVCVASDGRVFLSDSSQRFGAEEWGGTFTASIIDIMEGRATGRVLVFDPKTWETSIVMDGLAFANGVALDDREEGLFIVESGRYRVLRHCFADTKAGRVEVVLDNLPGYPDNLTRGESGRYWLGLAKPRNAFVDALMAHPFWKKVAFRLPRMLWPVPPAYGHVIAFEASGRIVADLQDPSGAYPETTGVTETGDRLYIQSLTARAIGYLDKRSSALFLDPS
jgi:sugar lactone lactonase YvrE